MFLIKKNTTATLAAGACVLLLVLALVSSRRSPIQREIAGTTMGTTYNVKYIVPTGTRQYPKDSQLRKDIQACLDDINKKMSTYIPDSELSRFNKHVENYPFAVSQETLEVFQLAHNISEATGGAFDITVGPIVNAYGFGPESRRDQPPSNDELSILRERVGFSKVQIDPQTMTLSKSHPDVYCDLSAIAKGYAVDKVAEELEVQGIRNYMVEIGGETCVKGHNIHGRSWKIGIEEPLDNNRAIHRAIELSDKAIATSGDYRNFYIQDGKRISHTIDPRTGKPVSRNLASVSVIHDRCANADAWATALMVLGPDEGYKLAETHGLAVLFLIRQKDETIAEKATKTFTGYELAKSNTGDT